jgi:hypothetical protein
MVGKVRHGTPMSTNNAYNRSNRSNEGNNDAITNITNAVASSQHDACNIVLWRPCLINPSSGAS